MPIEFRCTKCQKLLRTPDGSSGREAKCPQCGAIVKIPEPAAYEHAAAMPAPPVPSSSAPPSPADNPYASPSRLAPQTDPRYVEHAFRPTRIEVGDVLSRTWEVFKLRWLACVAATWGVPLILAGVCAPFILIVVFTSMNARDDAASVVAASLLLGAVATIASVWMALGIHAFMLKVARGEEVAARDLFGETSQLVPALLATILVGAAAMGGSFVARAQSAAAQPDVQGALLTEVRGLRTAIESLASAGPRVQLVLGRVQLQEQRILNQTRRLDAVSESLGQARRRLETVTERIKNISESIDSRHVDVDEVTRRGRENELADAKVEWSRLNADVQRLVAEEAAMVADLAAEQNRWMDFNRLLEDLERALARR